jgi:hypothetical protein
MCRVDPAPPPQPPLRWYGCSPPELALPFVAEPVKSSFGSLHLDPGARTKPPVVTLRILQVPPSVQEAPTRYVLPLWRKLSSTWARLLRRSHGTKQSVWQRLGSSARRWRWQCLARRWLGQRRGRPVLNGGGNYARPRSCVWARGG